jgi:hypothetical protein
LHFDSFKFFEEKGGDYDIIVKTDGNLYFPVWIIKSILDASTQPKTLSSAISDETFNESYLEFIVQN